MKFVSRPKAIDFKRIFTWAKRININWKAVQFSKPKSSCLMPETDFILCAFFNVVYCGGNRGFKSIVSNSDQNMALGLPCRTLARTIINRPFCTASTVCCIYCPWDLSCTPCISVDDDEPNVVISIKANHGIFTTWILLLDSFFFAMKSHFTFASSAAASQTSRKIRESMPCHIQ